MRNLHSRKKYAVPLVVSSSTEAFNSIMLQVDYDDLDAPDFNPDNLRTVARMTDAQALKFALDIISALQHKTPKGWRIEEVQS